MGASSNLIIILEAIRVVFTVAGAMPGLMALYDVIFGENHSYAGSTKKILGGIIFGVVAFTVMTWVITEIQSLG